MSTQIVSAVPQTAAELGSGVGNFGRRIQPGRATLLSIFPVELSITSNHAGRAVYVHPPADKARILEVTMNPERLMVQSADPDQPMFTFSTPKECSSGERGYTLLHVCDTYQWCNNYEREKMEPLPISAAIVAESLERSWVQGQRTASGKIGIKVLDQAKALKPQLDDLWADQTAYFRSLVNEADKHDQDAERKYITEIHRVAAKWMGIENRPWCKPMEERHVKRCPACSSDILAEALVCKECSTFLPEFYRAHQISWETDSAVTDFFRRMPPPVSAKGNSINSKT